MDRSTTCTPKSKMVVFEAMIFTNSECLQILGQSRNSAYFMDTEGSLPHSQEPAVCSYPERDQFSTCPQYHFWSPILIFLPFMRRFSKWSLSFVMSLRPSACPSAWNSSVPNGRIFIKFYICDFFENLSRKFKLHYNPTKITGTLHKEAFTFMTISR